MKVFIAFLALGFASVGLAAGAQDEIGALLKYVESLEGATFIRNGGSYPATQAVAHLRLKWEKQAKRITSAEDFIALCGSKSSMSGERYRIRFKDGSERFCDEVLTEQLRVMRQAKAPK